MKILRFFIIFLIAAALLAAAWAGYSLARARTAAPEASATPVPTATPAPGETPGSGSPSPAPTEVPVQTLEGTVYDATMSTLILQTADGSLYAFSRDDSTAVNAPDGILIGYRATVRYRGELDAGSLWQTAQAEAIDVTAAETAGPTDTPLPAGTPAATAVPAADRAARAAELLAGMTTEEKVGQMFLVRCPQGSDAAADAVKYHLGGYVLFGENTSGQTKASLRTWIAGIQSAAALPLLIAVDEEGGQVNRLSTGTAFRAVPFWSSAALFQAGGWSYISADTEEKCDLLRSLGISVNLAPVCDVCSDPASFMYARSFGGDAELTARYAALCVQDYAAGGVGCVLKHFPGYGDNGDTHAELTRDTRSLDTFESRDLLPFISGIGAGARAVLVAHNIVECFDADRPASLSPAVHQYLRQTLGFDGVIITDDLYMQAIRQFAGTEAAAVLAVQAGNDILCCTDYEVQIPAVLAAVNDGTLSEEAIDQAVTRILLWKLELGVIQ